MREGKLGVRPGGGKKLGVREGGGGGGLWEQEEGEGGVPGAELGGKKVGVWTAGGGRWGCGEKKGEKVGLREGYGAGETKSADERAKRRT